MGDVWMVLLIVAFFLGCIGYVTWCGHIIGPDPEEPILDDVALGDGADSHDVPTAVRS